MRYRILLVHNQPQKLEEIGVALSKSHAVTTCGGIQQALAVLKKAEDSRLNRVPFDLIISCVHIEGESLTVFDLLKWIRGNPQSQQVPFLLLCTEPSNMAKYLVDSIRLADSLGASGYIVVDKFDAADFVQEIEAYLPDLGHPGIESEQE